MPTREQRFWAKVDRTSGCWLWTASRDLNGYGQFWNGERVVPAHRWAYENFVEAVPVELVLDHLCRNRACVRPEHLDPVPQSANAARGLQGFALTGLCRAGLHDVTDPRNILLKSNGDRSCRPCKYARNNEWAARQRVHATNH